MTLNKCWVPWNAGALWNPEYPFIAITPRSALARVVTPDGVLSMGQIELFEILTEGKQMTNAKLSSLK